MLAGDGVVCTAVPPAAGSALAAARTIGRLLPDPLATGSLGAVVRCSPSSRGGMQLWSRAALVSLSADAGGDANTIPSLQPGRPVDPVVFAVVASAAVRSFFGGDGNAAALQGEPGVGVGWGGHDDPGRGPAHPSRRVAVGAVGRSGLYQHPVVDPLD